MTAHHTHTVLQAPGTVSPGPAIALAVARGDDQAALLLAPGQLPALAGVAALWAAVEAVGGPEGAQAVQDALTAFAYAQAAQAAHTGVLVPCRDEHCQLPDVIRHDPTT